MNRSWVFVPRRGLKVGFLSLRSWVFVPRRGLKVGFLSLRSWVFVPDFLPLSVVFQIVTLPFLRVLPSLADKKKPDNHTKHTKGTFLIT